MFCGFTGLESFRYIDRSRLIASGNLIPRNIPNIIAAHSLNIKSTEWARLGVPLGFILMAFTAVLLMFQVI